MNNNIQVKRSLKASPPRRETLVKIAVSGALFLLGILNGAAGEPSLLIVGVVTGILVFSYPYLNNGQRANATVRASFLLVVGVLTFTFLNLFAAPAQAQFFQRAQDFFTESFPASETAIPIVFNTLRGLYIIYLAIAFIGVFNSVRQDEDWVTAARTPIIVVICVTVADILTGLIVGSN